MARRVDYHWTNQSAYNLIMRLRPVLSPLIEKEWEGLGELTQSSYVPIMMRIMMEGSTRPNLFRAVKYLLVALSDMDVLIEICRRRHNLYYGKVAMDMQTAMDETLSTCRPKYRQLAGMIMWRWRHTENTAIVTEVYSDDDRVDLSTSVVYHIDEHARVMVDELSDPEMVEEDEGEYSLPSLDLDEYEMALPEF